MANKTDIEYYGAFPEDVKGATLTYISANGKVPKTVEVLEITPEGFSPLYVLNLKNGGCLQGKEHMLKLRTYDEKQTPNEVTHVGDWIRGDWIIPTPKKKGLLKNIFSRN
ncbi:hypothetical protein GOV13_05720 [Candidatus Pacearchaeota archaeon]|nr:hypothetical protein [Candidatus Pacearchaeota archaeon]